MVSAILRVQINNEKSATNGLVVMGAIGMCGTFLGSILRLKQV